MEFKDDERGYLEWKRAHADGLVLNTIRTPRSDSLMLHRATRPHLAWRNADVHWTKDDVKIRSTQVDGPVRWAGQRVAGNARLTPCATRKPLERAATG